MKFRELDYLTAATGLGFPLLSLVADRFLESVDLMTMLRKGPPCHYQIVITLTITIFVAAVLIRISRCIPKLDPLNRMTREMFLRMRPGPIRIVAVSAAAGIGEELLFRGVLQAVAGVLLSSLVFAALHIGFRFGDRVLRLYAGIVFLMSLTLGFISTQIGLIAAITAHFAWDATVLMELHKREHRSGADPGVQQNMQSPHY